MYSRNDPAGLQHMECDQGKTVVVVRKQSIAMPKQKPSSQPSCPAHHLYALANQATFLIEGGVCL